MHLNSAPFLNKWSNFTLLEATLQAIQVKDAKSELASKCVAKSTKRLKCFTITLKKVGPAVHGSLTTAYELWHTCRRSFTEPDLKPDAIGKADADYAIAMHKPGYRERVSYENAPDRSRQASRRDYWGSNHQLNHNKPAQRPQAKDRNRARSPAKCA